MLNTSSTRPLPGSISLGHSPATTQYIVVFLMTGNQDLSVLVCPRLLFNFSCFWYMSSIRLRASQRSSRPSL
jgi:hypothetical protein